MNCTCPSTTISQEHSPECNLRTHLAEVEESRDHCKNELRLLRSKYALLRKKVVDVEKRAIAGDGLADAVRFHSRMRNPESKKQSWYKLMDALEVHVKAQKETPMTQIRCGYCDEYQDEAVPHNPKTCIDSLTSRLEEEKKGRELDRAMFRQGVDAWQKRIAEAEKVAALHEKAKRGLAKTYNDLYKKFTDIENLVQVAQDTIAKRLRNCAGNFHEENPDGCKGSCQEFGCKTLRGIRDALKE